MRESFWWRGLEQEPYAGGHCFLLGRSILGNESYRNPPVFKTGGKDTLCGGNRQREFIHPLAIEGFCIPGLLDYENDADKKKIETTWRGQIGNLLREKKMGFIDYRICFVEKILADKKTGKKRLVMDRTNCIMDDAV